MLNPGQRVQYVAYATPDIRETPTTIQMDLLFTEETLVGSLWLFSCGTFKSPMAVT